MEFQFSLGKNDKVNALKPTTMKSHKVTHKGSNVVTQTTKQKPTIAHEEEKIALILSLTGTFTICYMF